MVIWVANICVLIKITKDSGSFMLVYGLATYGGTSDEALESAADIQIWGSCADTRLVLT
jgi:hypothetical protein